MHVYCDGKEVGVGGRSAENPGSLELTVDVNEYMASPLMASDVLLCQQRLVLNKCSMAGTEERIVTVISDT